MQEAIPLSRELVLRAKESSERGVVCIRNPYLQLFLRCSSENLATLTSCVFEMQNHIRERVEVEGIIRFRHLNTPSTNYACPLEWKIAFVAEVQLKHAAVVLRMAGGDRLHRREVNDEAIIVLVLSFVIGLTGDALDARLVAQESKCAVDARVWADDAGNGKADTLDATHVVAGIIGIEQRFRKEDFALPCLLKSNQRQRVMQYERDVFGDFILALTLLKVGYVQTFEVIV